MADPSSSAYQEAITLVNQKFNEVMTRGATEQLNLQSLLDSLVSAAAALQLTPVDVTIDEDIIVDDPTILDPHPEVPDVTVTFPTPPTDPGVVITMPDPPPDLDVTIDMPERPPDPGIVVTMPDPPPDLGVTIDMPPAPPDIDVSVNMPDPPPDGAPIVIDFPAPPPDVDATIDISDHVPPDIRELLVPNVYIDPSKNSYVSNLLNSLKSKILHDVDQGGTGLDPLVETDIWNRNYERDLQANLDAMDRISSEWAKRGNPLPDGFFANQITEQEINFTNKRFDTSRDISIKQAELAQTNTHFAIEKGIALENYMWTIENTFMERIYQCSKALLEANISVYNSQIQVYKVWSDIYQVLVNADIETAKAIIDIYRTKVEAYKAGVQAEGERIRALLDIQKTGLEVYKTGVQAEGTRVGTIVDVYKARQEGYKTGVMAESSRIGAIVDVYKAEQEGYKTSVQAESERVGASVNLYKTEGDVYKTGVEAEAGRVGAIVDVYKAEQEGYKTGVQAEGERVGAIVNVYKAEEEVYRTGVMAEGERIKAIYTKPQLETEIWKAQVSVYDMMSKIDIAMMEARLKRGIAKADLELKNAEMGLKEYEVLSGMQLESFKAAATIQSHFVAGLLSAVSAGASISGSGATQTQTSYKGAALSGAGSPTDVTHQHVYQET